MAGSDKSGKSPNRGGPISRRQARKRAVEVLYEAAQRGADAVTLLADRVGSVEVDPIGDYTISLVEGVTGRKTQIDELLSEHAQGWTLDRMPPVDLAVLRVGVYELLWATDVPDPVAIDEAVGLAKELSTDDSPRFVNGVLGRIGTIADRLRAVL
ncbi:transcription antitermination factor NusB [Amycolatopsis sp. WAC 01375]|uniref:transcription antitermination factor NusB n=1 Tax=unclassified Amycolatopsis TaxID=2618356 RepID=UPI000F78C6A1|nr:MULTISPECIES: transcription antitermination factor NusB [unclassified Amycolatopsis]RSM61282.1 transcription antitermination factor NusB [Amycolatopsis sp. WAC 01376]RSM80124.1 transcription antitermination factor NusB [Amycolatopsis sp. WAC 01375]RSN34231.1 transcription antitermination factor NusB [Amycolatopsis sp. WAC 01416]